MKHSKILVGVASLVLWASTAFAENSQDVQPNSIEARDTQLLAQAAIKCPKCALKVAEAKTEYTEKCGRAPTGSELRAIALFDVRYGQNDKAVIQCF